MSLIRTMSVRLTRQSQGLLQAWICGSCKPIRNFAAENQADKQQNNKCTVMLRGLPYKATAADVLRFFKDVDVLGGKDGVHLHARTMGTCFVDINKQDLTKAKKYNLREIGNRYIEILEETDFKRIYPGYTPPTPQEKGTLVKLKGLPFGCTKQDIATFFSGFEIAPHGIMKPVKRHASLTGEAYVKFASKEIAEKALTRHNEYMGSRYINVYPTDALEVDHKMSVPEFTMSPPHAVFVHSRKSDLGKLYIEKLFSPCEPIHIHLSAADGIRLWQNGTAVVEFKTHSEALEAMSTADQKGSNEEFYLYSVEEK